MAWETCFNCKKPADNCVTGLHLMGKVKEDGTSETLAELPNNENRWACGNCAKKLERTGKWVIVATAKE